MFCISQTVVGQAKLIYISYAGDARGISPRSLEDRESEKDWFGKLLLVRILNGLIEHQNMVSAGIC